MTLLTWISLLFLVIAIVGSLVFAGSHAFRAWRALGRFSRSTSSGLDAVFQSASEAEQHAVRLGAGSDRVSSAVTQLQRSLAELAVIRSAASDARTSLLSFRGAVPRK